MSIYVNPVVAGGIVGTGLAIGGSKIYTTVTGKPAGVPSSLAHIVTNDKLDSKPKVILEQAKEGLKDTVTLAGITAGTAATASLAAGNSKKVANFLHSAKAEVAQALENVVIQSKGQNLKEIIKNTTTFQKFNALPTAAKAGLLAGAAALAIVGPVVQLVSAQKAGYIEGKHEVK